MEEVVAWGSSVIITAVAESKMKRKMLTFATKIRAPGRRLRKAGFKILASKINLME